MRMFCRAPGFLPRLFASIGLRASFAALLSPACAAGLEGAPSRAAPTGAAICDLAVRCTD
eukprot:6409860-Pyramimonas_sp.AAC.1